MPFIEPSASGPTQKLVNHKDGTVHVIPGKAHEAKEGSVSNPGVRTISSATTGPRCPVCGESSLKMRMNRKMGERIYCSNARCNYDQSGGESASNKVTSTAPMKTVTNRGIEGSGVTIIRQSGPR